MDNRNFVTSEESLLAQVHDGMTVLDANNERIGTVTFVRFGDEVTNDGIAQTATAAPTDLDSEPDFLEAVVETFTGHDDIPEEVRARLLRYGFVRVDTGLLRRDLFVMPGQIAHVHDEHVHLNVIRDQLMKIR